MANRKNRKNETFDIDFINTQNNNNNLAIDDFIQTLKIPFKCKTQNQKKLIKLINDKEVVICAGPAGTGKTYVTCAEALTLLKEYPTHYKKIIIVKSVTTLRDEEVGFIKGNLKEKMEPAIYSFINNFEKLIGKYSVDKLRENGIIEEYPIAYMRGVNFDNAIIIIDEVQNVTISNARTILTRIGENAKMIFLGDEKQIDMKNPSKSSLTFLLDKFEELHEIGTMRFINEDIVRNPLIIKIEEIFDKN